LEITLLLKPVSFICKPIIMNRKTIFGTIGILALIASIVMYVIGGKSSHLSELKDFWWMPLILAAVCLAVAGSSKPKA
jgi:hypothetical protein